MCWRQRVASEGWLWQVVLLLGQLHALITSKGLYGVELHPLWFLSCCKLGQAALECSVRDSGKK